MEEGSKLDGGGGTRSAPDPDGRRRTRKGKSCKGALYHTSLRRSDGRNPLCVGITRTLPQVPGHTVGESEMETTKEGRSLSDFKYVCVGYSAFLDNKEKPSGKGESRAELPHCVGIELLIDRRPATAGHAPAHAAKEDDAVRPQPLSRSQPRQYKPAQQYTGEELLNRKACSRETLDWWRLEWPGTCTE
ncbi:uncharacterized protein M6B38_348995 [Iris pallida]|uniref:DUF8204 domain-containing protein n=1 Tax=Iris pallida TaxID=29817 RepID=A0AAX6GT59_IRIPA|nr:uncharacterized protein M6B38_194530 [Iris pallida]KAJ6831441.1 uncharacterized protein M6B38_348950 [Iris pallida]KAJ6831450.1 uncharacterized protein M6B38_348995 [Iris pallida]